MAKGSASQAIKPTFLYVGVAKAGSSWLFEVLREHPDVFVPIAKDLQFFERYHYHGLDWYFAHFRKGAGKKAIGELSHNYYLSADYAQQIRDAMPDVKIIVCLRKPIDKLVSWYVYNRGTYIKESTTLEEFAESADVRERLDYTNKLRAFYDRFPADRIKVVFFEEFRADNASFVKEVYRFIGVDDTFEPPSLNRKVLAAQEPRWELFAHFAYSAGHVIRRVGLANVVGAVKRSALFEKTLYRPNREKPKPSEELRRRIHERCSPDYGKLEEMIGRKLPAAWWKA